MRESDPEPCPWRSRAPNQHLERRHLASTLQRAARTWQRNGAATMEKRRPPPHRAFMASRRWYICRARVALPFAEQKVQVLKLRVARAKGRLLQTVGTASVHKSTKVQMVSCQIRHRLQLKLGSEGFFALAVWRTFVHRRARHPRQGRCKISNFQPRTWNISNR